jgi:hypothetical protein
MSALTEEDLISHDCGVSFWREYDAQGIYLCRVCDTCRDVKLSRYRPEILRGYTQADVDEPIDDPDNYEGSGIDY